MFLPLTQREIFWIITPPKSICKLQQVFPVITTKAGPLISLCCSLICRSSRKTKVSCCPNRKITRGSLRIRDRPGPSTCRLNYRKLWRELAGAVRRRSGGRVKSASLRALRSSKSWTRSLGKRRGRRQGQMMATKMVKEKKFQCRQSENTPKANTRAGSMEQKVIRNAPSCFQIIICFQKIMVNF